MKNDLPLVSVAVITYNQLPFLKACIDSICAQNYPNIELVVADDGSTDGTRRWLTEELQPRDGLRLVIRASDVNRGITANSNEAFRACTGRYICWMGGDDLMLPGKIRKQVEHMEAHPAAALCFHDLDVFESDSNKTIYLFSEKNRPRVGKLREVIKWGVFNGACSTMVKSECCPPQGFDERVPIASDWLFWVQSLRGGHTIDFIPEVLGRYRRHSGNVTSQDRRLPPVANIQDHLNSCALILSEFPEYTHEIRYRLARLLLSLRFSAGGVKYRHYLIASLRHSITFHAIGALSLNLLTRRTV